MPSRRSVLKTGALGISSLLVGRYAFAEKATPTATPSPTGVPTGAVGSAAKAANEAPTPGAPNAILRVATTPLDPDGKKKVQGVTVNGTFPGPEIRVREGDVVRFQLENHLTDQDTFIHWHGLLVPAAMDGVPGVSGPPVPPAGVFVYEFPIRQSGTYWYHSHVGFQEQIGMAGAFVIEPKKEPGRYDKDAVVLLSDWMYSSPYDVIPKLRAEGGGAGAMKTKSNAAAPMAKASPMPGKDAKATKAAKQDGSKGATKAPAPGMAGMAMSGADLSDVKYDAFLMNGRAPGAPWTLEAKPGERVRLRLINGGASTYFEVSLDGHSLEVTHADGLPVKPVVVDRILMGMAECYDVVVTLEEPGSYTLHAVAQDGSGQAIGVLHSPGAKPAPNVAMPKPGPKRLTYPELVATEETTLPEGSLQTFRLPLGGDMRRYIWTIEGQAYPDAKPLPIRQGDRVRIDLVNETAMWHPMHLHGHFFRVITDDGAFCPLKHTVNVAPKELIRIEFTADNPGRWFFHCHNLYHLEAGMARVWEYESV